MTSSSPIGVFDSGIGGLSVIKALREQLPNEDVIYLGDTARVPYGTKTAQTVTRFSFQDSRFLLERNVKMVVVACNTASALAINALRSSLDVPVLGVVEPGAHAAVAASTTGVIGVIGTEATINSGCYERAIFAELPGATVVSRACPLFVPLVEEGWLDDPVTYQVAERYLADFRERTVDVLILGCTHYPLLAKVVADVLGPGTAIVDSASSVSQAVELLLEEKGLINPSQKPGRCEFYVTDLPAKVSKIGKMFLGVKDLSIELVQLD